MLMVFLITLHCREVFSAPDRRCAAVGDEVLKRGKVEQPQASEDARRSCLQTLPTAVQRILEEPFEAAEREKSEG